MSRIAKLALVVVAAAATAFLLWRETPPPPPSDPIQVSEDQSSGDRDSIGHVSRASHTATEPGPALPATVATSSPWRIHGTVRDEKGAPIAAAFVQLRGLARTSQLALLETSANGAFEVDLEPVLAPYTPYWRRSQPLLGEAGAPGYEATSSTLRRDLWSPAADRPVDFTLSRAKPRVKGHLRDADGRPVARARVALQPPDAETVIWSGYCQTTDEGYYQLEVPATGSFFVRAVAFDRGIGSAGPIALDPDRDTVVPDIVVTGAGVIAGTVNYPDGRPARQLTLVARPAAWLIVHPWYDARPAEDFAGRVGLDEGQVQTDTNGRFRFAGLTPGVYRISLQETHNSIVGNDCEVPTGTTNVALVVEVFGAHVRVVDEQGNLQPDATVQVALKVVGLEEYSTPAVDVATGERWFELMAPDDRVAFTITAWVTGRMPATATIRIGAEDYVQEVELVVREMLGEPGSILLQLTDEWERPLSRASITLKTLAGIPVRGFENEPLEERGRLSGVPPGRWLVQVTADDPLGRGEHELPMLFPVEQAVDVVASEPTSLPLTARAGSRVRLRVRAPDGLPNDNLQGTITACRSGEPPIAIERFLDEHGSIEPVLRNGASALARELLVPGDYSFRFAFEGYAAVERLTTLRRGEITDIDIDLVR